MKDDSEKDEIEELAKFTTLADEIMGIEKWAEKRPTSITAYFLQQARTSLWNTPNPDARHIRQARHTVQAVVDHSQALLEGESSEDIHPAPAKRRGRPPVVKKVSLSAGDPRRLHDWRMELLTWGASHNGVIDLDQYREQKWIKDYPGLKTNQTRYAQGINELKRLHLIDEAGRRRYTVNEAGRAYLASNMNTPTAPNTPTPPPEPPPPVDYQPPPFEDAEDEPVINKTTSQTLGRMIALAKKNNGLFVRSEYTREVKRRGWSVPSGQYLAKVLNDPSIFTRVGSGEYLLVGHEREAGSEPPLSEAILAFARERPDHRVDTNEFRKDFEKRYKKRPMTMQARIESSVRVLSREGALRRIKTGLFELVSPAGQQPLPLAELSSTANA